MALKVKAKESLIKIGKYADTYRYVMIPELYGALDAYMMMAFVSCPDYETFLSRFGRMPHLKFAARMLRETVLPTVCQILDDPRWVTD